MAPSTKRPTERLTDLDKAPRIQKMRDQNKTWREIGESLKMTAGRAQFILLVSQVRPKDKIKFTDDADLAKKIVHARDKDKLSWPVIAARSNVTEGRVKDIYRRTKEGKPLDARKATNGTRKKATAKKAVKKATAKPAAKRVAKRRTKKPADPSAS